VGRRQSSRGHRHVQPILTFVSRGMSARIASLLDDRGRVDLWPGAGGGSRHGTRPAPDPARVSRLCCLHPRAYVFTPTGCCRRRKASLRRADHYEPDPVRPVAESKKPHVPLDRLLDGTWLYAPYGAMRAVASGRQVVCHACGEPLAAISAQHARRHGLSLAAYRERFGLNRKQSLLAPEPCRCTWPTCAAPWT
jgi:hypothetical protein